MDFFICLPILFGCQTKIKPEGDQTPRICPRCHNAAVTSAKSREWFEICFVPLIPMSSNHIWICSICSWSVHVQPGWEPQMVTHMAPMGPYPSYGQSQLQRQNFQQPYPQQPGYHVN